MLFRSVDKSKIYKISEIQTEGAYLQFKGKVTSYEILGEKYSRRLVAQFQDESGKIDLVWFNSIKWVEDLLREKRSFIVFGKPTQFNRKWNITHPDLLDPQAQSDSAVSLAFQPLYNTSEKAKKGGLDSRTISKLVITLLSQIKDIITERLNPYYLEKYKLLKSSKYQYEN